MTNILEKSLLTGFGVFLLIMFLSFIAPFINSMLNFKSNETGNLESYISFIDEIDKGINYIIKYPDKDYLQTIDYPKNLNMSFKDNMAKFFFKFEETSQTKIIEYSKSFVKTNFENIKPQFYVLNISMKFSNILIELK